MIRGAVRATVACTVVAATLLLSQPAAAAGGCAVDYVAQLRGVRVALDAPGADASAQARALDDLATADSAHAALDPVIAELDGTPPDLVAARSDLDSLLAALQPAPHAVCGVDTGPARDALRQTYQSPVFAGLDRSPGAPGQSPVAQALSTVVRTLGVPLTIALAAVILALVAVYAVHRLRGATGTGTAEGAVREEPGGGDPDEEWRAALAAAERGDHREAIRRAFRSVLLSVALAGRLPVNAAWTTRELLRHATGDADLVAALAPAAELFDRAWYSGADVGAADWETARSRCAAIRELASRRPVAA